LEPDDVTTLKLGLIGTGISRTQVHQLHALLGDLHGVSVSYELMDIPSAAPFDLRARLAQCAGEGYTGVNVTHPFKLQAYGCVTDRRWLPTGLESVNTVVFDGDTWRGGNTDHSGFIAAYRARFGDALPGRVLIAGAGGVGVSIALALATLGAGSLAIHDTEALRVSELVRRVQDSGTPAHAVQGGEAGLVAEARAADGLVNATPLGMHQYAGSAFPASCFAKARWVFDAVYTPRITPFLAEATSRGIAVMGGFDLFLHQGFDAFEKFSGMAVDRDQAIAAYLRRHPQPA
jgi:quinate/shikimate dehydrogenase (NAD+)